MYTRVTLLNALYYVIPIKYVVSIIELIIRIIINFDISLYLILNLCGYIDIDICDMFLRTFTI